MQEEEERSVADPRQSGTEASVESHLLVFLADDGLDLFPLHAKRRIGKHVVEELPKESVGGEGVPEDDVGDVLALDEHVGLADGVGFGIELLPVHDEAGVRIEPMEVFPCLGEHAARSRRGVVDGADDTGLVQGIVILDEEEIHHEADDLTRGEVFSGGLVGKFGEFTDQLLKDRPHLVVADHLGMQINPGELLCDLVKQAGLDEAVDLGVELEPLEDVPDRSRECLDVGTEVLPDVILIAHQLFQVEGRGVVKVLPGLSQQERLGIDPGLGTDL